MHDDLPEFRDWSIAAIWLLKGVVYSDESRVWDILLANISQLEENFSRLGLRLVVDEPEGMAYLRQLHEDERPEGYDALPKLFHTTRLSYGATLLCVLLRDELQRFEEEDVHNERCVIDQADLFDQWKAFFPVDEDEVRQFKELKSSLKKLEEMGFVKKFGEEPVAWEIRRILKARLTAEELERLHAQLVTAGQRRTTGGTANNNESESDE